jgi:hypothetical protein
MGIWNERQGMTSFFVRLSYTTLLFWDILAIHDINKDMPLDDGTSGVD